jgi:hypothetical protein
MEEQCSARITWDVLVSSLHFGCRGCILDEGWAALDSARHRGDQRESDRGSEHRLESRAIAEGRQKDLGREVRVENLPRVQVSGYSTVLYRYRSFRLRRPRSVSVSVSSRSLQAHSTTVSKDGSAPLGQHKY